MESPYAFNGMKSTYHSVLGNPATRLVSSRTVDWHGRPHRELVLDTVMPDAYAGTPIKRRYGLFVRPERPGVVCGYRHYDNERLSEWLVEQVMEYQPGDDPFPALKSIEVFVTDKTAGYQPWRAQLYEVTEYTRLKEPIPEREFKLTAFDLPEPTTIPPWTEGFGAPSGDINSVPAAPSIPLKEPSYWWLWVILGAVLLATVGLFVRYRRRSDAAGD